MKKILKLPLFLLILLIAVSTAIAGFGCTTGLSNDQDLEACIGGGSITVTGAITGTSGVNASAAIPCDFNIYVNESGTPTSTNNQKIGTSTNISTVINLTFVPESYFDSNRAYKAGWNCTNNTNAGVLGATFSCNSTGITWECYRMGDFVGIISNLIGTVGMAVIVLAGIIVMTFVVAYALKKFNVKLKLGKRGV